MGVSVHNILDAGLLSNGKFPDIYWDLDLTCSELKIVRYVYNNCLRLYKDVKIFPRGKDGSPRFWRGKERMADDCGLSYPTFRNSVRHLAEMGVVTSMDYVEDSENIYCIGLCSDFLNCDASYGTENNFRSHSLKKLLNLIYNNLTVELIIKQLTVYKMPSYLLRKYELCEPLELQDSSNLQHKYENNSDSPLEKSDSPLEKSDSPLEINRIPIQVKRIPIQVKRIPVLQIPAQARIESARQKLKMLQNVRTPFERSVLQVVEYYEYKCRQAICSSGFKALGKDFRNHKHWKFFVNLYKLCNENGWDYKIYIDAQFDRVKYWKRKQLYPYANQFTSEGAINYFHKYVNDYKEKYSVTGDTAVKTSKIKSINHQIIDDVIKDCEGISDYITKAGKRRVNRDLTPEQLKILYLSDHWMCLSSYYLASIPWFITYLSQFPDETIVNDVRNEVEILHKSTKMMSLIQNIVSNVESQMNIPHTLNT